MDPCCSDAQDMSKMSHQTFQLGKRRAPVETHSRRKAFKACSTGKHVLRLGACRDRVRRFCSFFRFFIATMGLLWLSSSCVGLPVKKTNSECPEGLVGQIDALELYTVNEGKLHRVTISGEELRNVPVSVEGYVCGVVLSCSKEVRMEIEGMEDENSSVISSTAEGVSCFPLVKGSAVNPNDQFRIRVKLGSETMEIPVRQKGYKTLEKTPYRKDLKYGIDFRYLGSRPQFFESADFRDRLAAIAEGVDAVHRTFDTRLVQNVNIIDYEEIHNVVISEDEGTIWFYANALQNEPVKELRIIAEHEAIHLLVAKKGLTKSSELREIFADLKGYGPFSYERLFLLSKGVVPPNRKGDKERRSIFFSFIDEKNFIAGMKGGHSHEDLAEFCTSFLHSLMYVERLESNLETVLLPRGPKAPSTITPSERKLILENYRKVIEILMRTVTPVRPAITPANPDRTTLLLKRGLEEVQKEMSSS